MRKNRKHKKMEHDNLDRWLVSYADFMTLLFAFFVVMYAISSVNTGKYRILSDSLIESFDGATNEIIELDSEKSSETKMHSDNLIELPVPVDYKEETDNDLTTDNPNTNPTLNDISTEVSDAVQDLMDEGLISLNQNENWLEIEIKSSILFESGGAVLSEDAEDVLAKLASIIKSYPNQLQIEGYTDDVPIRTKRFLSNWELSSSRASSVVHLFEEEGVNPDKMLAIGYGQYKAKTSNKTAKGRRENRRVVLVVLGSDNTRKSASISPNRVNRISDVEASPGAYRATTKSL